MRVLILLASVLGLTACFDPNYGNPSFSCSADGECPSGYTCNLADMGCYKGAPDRADASTTNDDASVIDASTFDADTTDATIVADAALDDGGAPLNDLCSAADSLTDNVVAGGTTGNAGDELDFNCNGSGHGDVFYEFTLAAPKSVVIELVSTGNTNLAVLSDCSTTIQCSAQAGTGETLDIPFLAAGTYFIAVESNDGSAQGFTIKYTESAARPPNDDCQGAIELQDGVTLTNQTMVNAADDSSGSCSIFSSQDVVFFFDVPAGPNRRATITASNAVTFQPLLFLDDNCPGTEVECADFSNSDAEVLDATSLAPGRYYLWVDAVGGLAASFDISLVLEAEIPPPTNDVCSTTDTFVSGTPVNGTTSGAANDYDLSCANPDGRDTVHNFNIAADSSVLIEVTPTSAWDPAVALRAGATCDPGPDLYCSRSPQSNRYINVPSLAAGDYSALVDGVAGSTGDYTISLDATTPVDGTFGYKVVRTTGSYVSIDGTSGVTSPTVNDNEDDTFFTAPIGFTFPYFGDAKTSVSISMNGYLGFDPDVSGIPSRTNICPQDDTGPNNMIAVFWDDLYARSGYAHRINHKTVGTSPNQQFIVEWFDFEIAESEPCQGQCLSLLGAHVTQQVILHENGDIEMRYGPRVQPALPEGGDCSDQHLGCTASIGLENSGGTDVDIAECNNPTAVDNGTVIYFVHPTPLVP